MENLTQFSAVERPALRRVPTYDTDNQRIRSYSEQCVRDLADAGRMALMLNRDGKILWAQFIRRDPPRWRTASKAKYKLLQIETQLPGIEACAALFAVPLDMDRTQLAAFQRAIFQQVLLSCYPLHREPAREKVVSIDTYRRNRRRAPKPEKKTA